MHARLALLALLGTLGCAHESSGSSATLAPQASTCQSPEASAVHSLAQAQPALELHELRWILGTGDSGALTELPPTVHAFTLGRWECALSPELSADALADGQAEVNRTRKLVCTHATGLTMQTRVGCTYTIPAAAGAGTPKAAAREARITLSDAPTVVLACEARPSERLTLFRGERQPLATACLIDGRITACTP